MSLSGRGHLAAERLAPAPFPRVDGLFDQQPLFCSLQSRRCFANERNRMPSRQFVGHVDDKSGIVLLDHGDGGVVERRNQAHGKVGHEPADDRAVT